MITLGEKCFRETEKIEKLSRPFYLFCKNYSQFHQLTSIFKHRAKCLLINISCIDFSYKINMFLSPWEGYNHWNISNWTRWMLNEKVSVGVDGPEVGNEGEDDRAEKKGNGERVCEG